MREELFSPNLLTRTFSILLKSGSFICPQESKNKIKSQYKWEGAGKAFMPKTQPGKRGPAGFWSLIRLA